MSIRTSGEQGRAGHWTATLQRSPESILSAGWCPALPPTERLLPLQQRVLFIAPRKTAAWARIFQHEGLAACLETAGFGGRPGSARASSREGEQLTEGRLAPVGPEHTLKVRQGLAHGDEDGSHPCGMLPAGQTRCQAFCMNHPV